MFRLRLIALAAAVGKPGRNELIGIDTRTCTVVQRTALPDFACTMATGLGSSSIWVVSNDDGRI